jgi:hypothetical protein
VQPKTAEIESSDLNIYPTIYPFQATSPPNAYTSFAGITTDQLSKARERRNLADPDASLSSQIAKDEQLYY